MDQGLSIILKSYRLPVVVMGREHLLADFKKITKNDENIAQFIPGNYEEVAEPRLISEIKNFESNWKKLKPQYLLKKVEKAKVQNKLKTGIEDILKATSQNKGKLLLVEKKFVNRSKEKILSHSTK